MDDFEKLCYAVFTFISALIAVTLCWVGAEYVFEGTVHSSDVDGAVAVCLAYLMTKECVKKKDGGT